MKSGNNKRTLFLLLVLGVLLAIAYPMFRGDVSSDAPIIDQASVSEEVVIMLNKLQSVDLNISTLDNTAFTYLKDITTLPLTLPVGRENPFAPVR